MIELCCEGCQCRIGSSIGHTAQQHQARAALVQHAEGRLVVGALDQVARPMSRHQPGMDLERAHLNTGHLGNLPTLALPCPGEDNVQRDPNAAARSTASSTCDRDRHRWRSRSTHGTPTGWGHRDAYPAVCEQSSGATNATARRVGAAWAVAARQGDGLHGRHKRV